MHVNSVPWSLFASTVHWRYPDLNHFRHSNRLRTYLAFFSKNRGKAHRPVGDLANGFLLGFRECRLAEHLGSHLATDDSRPHSRSGDRPLPSPPFACIFPLRGTAGALTWLVEPVGGSNVATCGRFTAPSSGRVATTRAVNRSPSSRLSGWLGPAFRLCSAVRSTGPERAVTLTAGAVRCGLERPLVSLGRSTHDRACWGSLRSSSASAGRSGGQRLAALAALCCGPRSGPFATPKNRNMYRNMT